MNKTQLQQKIVDMEKQLAELKKELEKKDKGIWKPDEEDEYYIVWVNGDVCGDINQEVGCDIGRFEFGNYYKTKEEAEKMSNYLKYTNLLRKYVKEHSEPIDWRDDTKSKYYIWYDHNRDKIRLGGGNWAKQQGSTYASSEKVLSDAIEFVGEENIRRHIFGIEE